jgi:osmoprotectant transport system ATP-binding protein
MGAKPKLTQANAAAAESPHSAIRFDGVSMAFPQATHPAIERISLDVRAGEFVVLLGPSGCGKTTLLKVVNRLYDPTAGSISLDSTDIRQLPVTALRRRIGYVIQQAGLFPHMSVAQNVAVVPKLLGWSKQQRERRTDELLELVELPPSIYRDRYPHQLSGGQQQRVGLVRALAGDPGVLLMDEPFGAIDAITRNNLQAELLRLQQQFRKTILFVTHDVDEALRLADRIAILQQGKLVQFDTPLQLLTHPANEFVRQLMGTDDVLQRLGVVKVEAVMTAWPPGDERNGQPVIARQDNLRQALSVLLQTGASQLMVLEGEQAVGSVNLEGIRQAIGSEAIA